MEVFRICQEAFSSQLNSSGAASRWNLRGEHVLYAGSSRSLATLELIVHKNSIVVPGLYKVMIISVADDENFRKQIDLKDLPTNWRSFEAYSKLQAIGSKWYNSHETLALKVPSAVIPQEYNYVINTQHPDFKKNVELISTENYLIDTRLL
jgi:RES domain-containing protein